MKDSNPLNNPATGSVEVFSGIQPTGVLHLGNYLGAVRYWPRLAERFGCIYAVVDLHAITVDQDPVALQEQTLQTAAWLLAAGVDPQRHPLLVQSMNPHHASMAWLLSCVARVGWLGRMTQFKEKSGRDRQQASVGLLTYPVLMAADVLVHGARLVPVGDDQRQHLELTRDIALAVNQRLDDDVLIVPEPLIQGEAVRVMSLRDGRVKMSKSDDSDLSRINLTDDADTLNRKIRKARTDSLPLPESVDEWEGRLEAQNLVRIMAAVEDRSVEDVLKAHAGRDFSRFKADLTQALVETLTPIQQRYHGVMADRAQLIEVLQEGARRSMESSGPVIERMSRLMGLGV